ncbi:MAG: hypothetical protein K9N46_05490 [Candidatus Marinimicrobia bacterium]|nr:hypothetical protein [Candidatus Neomarinimicrobiota bacterium]MCF7880176.1 hypothetical protein [Candidatus Neomarinimicrobiota bacterium]
MKEPNQPDRRRRQEYYVHQDPEILFHKLEGLFFSIDEEENISIIDVKKRVAEQFDQNYEKVTKKFYRKFKTEHRAFRDFIEGIDEQVDKDWYASLMLNRLMFIYFIQKKGFLNEDRDYLRTKLNEVQENEGENEFYGFYKDFLKVLFHKGLGHPDRTENLEEKLGRVPYLNGGLFDVHELEATYPELQIKDDAFERLFDFFDEYNWYLDTRKTATGKDINPDVIGYIFEKYINDRAQMGAYYTQEDITDYISKNSILPWMFDEIKRIYPKPFGDKGEVWDKLRSSGDTYIYGAVKTGVDTAAEVENPESIDHLDIPEHIARGIDTDAPDLLERREEWNTPTPGEHGLPTEIWRETIERWERYFDIKSRIAAGEIDEINDFITYNLDIKQFSQDLVENTDDPELIKACWKALSKITVLDPTCGSGAFLFAALNILEPLYASTLQKMESFIEDSGKEKYQFFHEELEKVNAPEHPNREYFIFKSIILNNLYGVDIMHEAVEIAKLRLFLKLMATVDVDYSRPNLGLEPLPDIDFNIRAGNTLVGYASKDEFEQLTSGEIDFGDVKQSIFDQADLVRLSYQRFKEKQLTEDYESTDYKSAKEMVNQTLDELNDQLNRYLAKDYLKSNYSENRYQSWLESHQPFHWFAEFYDIIEDNGGFDIVIGNPPYVEYSDINDEYSLNGYKTIQCGNLYAYVLERTNKISNKTSLNGMIVQLSIVCTDRMTPIQKFLMNNYNYLLFANFDDRPGKLFNDLQHIRATIILMDKSKNARELLSTNYKRWYSENRKFLFQSLSFIAIENNLFDGSILKIGNALDKSIINKIETNKKLGINLPNGGKHEIYYHNAPQYWVRCTDFRPYFWNERDGEKLSSQVKILSFIDRHNAVITLGLLNSNLFYWWYVMLSDGRHLNKREVENFPISIDRIDQERVEEFEEIRNELMEDLRNNSNRKEANYKTTGKVVYEEYFPKYSKEIIDKFDQTIASHYDFTQQELDYLINYDIKYRMGDELNDD